MLGHFLITLTREEEDRVLTGRLHHCMDSHRDETGRGCLLQTVDDVTYPAAARFGHFMRDVRHINCADDLLGDAPTFEARLRDLILHRSVGHRYDALCERFGVAKIGSLIRERIWRNRAWRALQAHMQQQREMATA